MKKPAILLVSILAISANAFCAERPSGDNALSAAAASFKEDFSTFADQACGASVKRFESSLEDVFNPRFKSYGSRAAADHVSSSVPFESRLMEDIPGADSGRVRLIAQAGRRFYPGASGFLNDNGIKVSLPAAISPVGEKQADRILRFEDALGMARDNSPQIKASRSSLSAAMARRKETGRDVLPQFYLEGSQDKGRILEDVHFREKRYGLSLQDTLYASGGKMAAWRQAGNQYQVADLRLTKEHLDLYLRIAQNYYELAKTLMVFRIQQMLLEEIDNDMTVEEEKSKRGLITEEEIMEMRGRRDTCAFQVIASDKEVTLARYKLAQSLGISEDELQRMGTPDSEINVGPQASGISLDDVIAAAFARRPELEMARLMVDVGKDEKVIAASKDASHVEVNGFYGKSASYYITEPERYKEDWNVMVKFTKTFGSSSLDYDYTKDKTSPKLGQSDRTGTDRHEIKLGLMDNYAKDSRIKKAAADYDEAVKDLSEAEKELYTEAYQAFFDYRETVLRLSNSLDKVRLAAQKLISADYQARLGQTPPLQVMEAKIKLAEEKTLYVQALADLRVSLFKLDKAVGEPGKFTNG